MKNWLFGCAIAAVATSSAYAQETTSSIRGDVSAAGAPVVGATVAVTHVPSGTTAMTTTGADGSFATSGLRPGGPFTVKVVAEGQAPVEITGIQLTAGQPLRLPIALDVSEEIVVAGKRDTGTALSIGPASAFNREAIQGVASISRDIRDIAKRDPFATLDPGGRGLQIAGQNSRLNKFSVDGLRFSDNFGLNNGGLPTARGPVPLDAIEQLSVKIAPYDISEGDFQGGAINLVLRSGNNNFTGSGFYTYTDDRLTGDNSRSQKVDLDYKSKNYGGFLSGPIIKDKLFFALSYERLDEKQPAGVGLAGAPNVVPNLSQADIDQISSIAQSRYDYDTLGVLKTVDEADEKYTAKLDWNIVDGQRASFTYIHNKGSQVWQQGASTSEMWPSLGLKSINVFRPEIVDSGVFQLNSDWSDNFHSEARLNYREYDLLPVPFGEMGFAAANVCLDPNAATQRDGQANADPNVCATRTPQLSFGPTVWLHANLVRTRQYGGDVTLRWEAGDHALKLNTAYSHLSIDNLFVINALGSYNFDSVADFQAGRAGSLALSGSISGDINDLRADFAYDQYTFGLQDSWDITPSLNVTYGARADLYGMSDRPPLNTNFVSRNGFPNTYNYSGKYVVQPRLGVTWQTTDRLLLRGGFGLFAGGSPDVFLGNSFSVAGVYGNQIYIQRTANGCNVPASLCAAALDNVDGRNFRPEVLDYLRTNTGSLANANVNAMTGNFKPTSSWKGNISADYKADLGLLGDGWHFGGDLYYGIVNNAPAYTDLRAVRIGTAPDGRPRYSTDVGPNADFLLYNTHKGRSFVGVARFDKSWDFGLTVGGSYTFQDITEVNPMSGTTAASSYGDQAVLDPNGSTYGTSGYQTRHSWKFNIDFDHAFFDDYKTRVNLFGELRSGAPYSITMNDPNYINGRSSVFGVTGSGNRFLLYVPNISSMTADALVTYDSAATYEGLKSLVESEGLKQGAIAGKNKARSPNFFKVDLHVDQELPVPLVGGAKFKMFADFENVLNMIDRDWGSYRTVWANANVVDVSCVASGTNGCAQYRYSNFQNPVTNNQSRQSLWGVRVGARFEF